MPRSYLYVVQGYYTPRYGWEDLTASEEWAEAKANARDYRENDSAPIRIVHRRETPHKKPAYRKNPT